MSAAADGFSARVVDERQQVTAEIRVTVETAHEHHRRNVLAMAESFVARLHEWLRSDEAIARRRRRRRGVVAPPHGYPGPVVVVDAPPLSDLDGLAPTDTWPLVELLSSEPHLAIDGPELVKVALDRHWGIEHQAFTWLLAQYEAHPDAALVLGWLALRGYLEQETRRQARHWSVETADLTPNQAQHHARVAEAQMRWRLEHQPDTVLKDATRAEVEAEAAHQYRSAHLALSRTKWLRAIAAELPDEDAVVGDHLKPARVLELRLAATTSAKQLPAIRRRSV